MFRSVSKVSGLMGRSQLPALFPVFNINSRLFWGWLFFASRLMPYGKLPASTREKLILRTAWNCRSRYEWGQHVEIALKNGVTDQEILQLAKQPGLMAGMDATLMKACDELCQNKLIAEDTWQTLSQSFSQSALIEIMILVGHYEMVAGFLINAGLQLEDSIEAELAALHQRLADQL